MPRFFAKWHVCHCLAVLSTFAISFSLGSLALGETKPTPQPLFDAIVAGDLDASLVPRDSRRATIQFKNNTDRPLTIEMPPAFAASPILAQQPFAGGFGQQNNNQNNAPQQLGTGMNGNNNGGNNGFNNNGFNNAIFNIPAGRVIRVKVDCVCLEYGKPEPDARMKYELKPLADVCDQPELVNVLRSLGNESIDQRVAQAATWHLTNRLGWNQIGDLVRRKVGGVTEMQFQTSEVATAKQLIDRLRVKEPAKSERNKVASATYSERDSR